MLVLALTGGFAAAANYEAQAETESVSTSAVPPAPDLGPAEAANESEARILAQMQGRRIEILSRRTATGGVWADPEGSLTTEAYPAPIRVKENGAWKDIDTTPSRRYSPAGSSSAPS
ncbi:hypothetical protein OG413_31225 [Streptomyces sp. NBC_01433]|uniref:hypothetical protein n=1 Tax=Streptomyces sp. NBC_01433 TaxID=2903864 RepID=UPI00224F29B7|nr:hypothetical protein [Streptomyces sp. NBC_01433]MCX4679701.1 hypothetical protein [Streptomyces sp. NBC_01433]